MRIRVSVPEEHVNPSVVNAALEAVTRLDEQLIRSGQSPTASQLISAGAKWKPEPPGDECFDHGGTIAARGWGDCDDWAPLAAAEHRVKGTDPGASAIVIPSGPNTYHAVVQKSDGSIEDPSLAAGMRPLKHQRVSGPEEGDPGAIYIQACDPHNPSQIYEGSLLPTTSPMGLHCGPQIAVRKSADGCCEGRCDVPIVGAMAPVRTHIVSGAALPYALAHQAYAPDPRGAVMHAVEGALQTAEATGHAAPEDYVKLCALHGMISGADPREVYAHLSHCYGPEHAYAACVGAYKIARRFKGRYHHGRHHHVHGVAHAAVAPTW
jgi:hypothetical protein